jgi:hypothetical protein
MAITDKRKRHKLMERAIRSLMGANLPPRFKFKDTYASIEVPTAYTQHLPTQQEIEDKFDELETQEEAVEAAATEATVISKVDAVITSNLEVGTSNLFVDTETGRVGMGTTSPQEKLHVYTDSASSGTQLFIRNANASNRAGLSLINSDNEYLNIQHTTGGSNAAIIENYSQTNGGIAFYAKGDGEYTFRTTDSNSLRMVIDNDGNVGIGTNNPTAQLSLGAWASGTAGTGVDTQLLLSGPHNSGANTGSTFKLKIEGYDNDGSTIYPIYCKDENSNIDFYIKNRPSASGIPTMFFAGDLTVNGGITKTQYRPGEIIETLQGRANGRSIEVLSGTYTLTNVSGLQNATTSHAVINGSSISYKPPPGTTRVIYEFWCFMRQTDVGPILHFAGRVAGTQVTESRHTWRESTANNDYQTWIYNNMTLTIGEVASDSLASGRLASWTTNKTLDFTFREYSASYEGRLHMTNHWDGAGTDIDVKPVIKITAIA